MAELWYSLDQIPDLTLNKYASLEGNGVDGVLDKHVAFLRQLNRKGVLSNLSFHLFYLYLVPEDESKDSPGHRLKIFLLIRGDESQLGNVPALIKASPLSDFFVFENEVKLKSGEKAEASIDNILGDNGLGKLSFDSCAILTKAESTLPGRDGNDYYIVRDWEMNEDARLYNMCNMMEALQQTVLYRVDLYPVERSETLRENLRRPISILRQYQDERGSSYGRDYEGKDALDNYEDLIDKFDSSPHFAANIMVFANGKENSATVLDAAGAESLMKGRYTVTNFFGQFDHLSFLGGEIPRLENIRDNMVLIYSKKGLIVCKSDREDINLRYLPTLFSLEEIAPFFRLPALYDGEVIQIAKETAPEEVAKEGSIYLGKDKNGYDVRFPLKLLPKHAFISGVPGSGKTNTMHHITSTLWKEHHIPFLVLEPAKQEYRALCNDPGMKELYLFSPNADMSFPLHINPFEMPKGTLVAEHIRKMCSVFEGAFPLEPPMPFLLDTSIEAVYRELGWLPDHVYTGTETKEDGKTRRPLPTMSMLYKKLEEELRTTKYSDEVRGNLESALQVRIGSLLRREMGDVFDVPESTFEPEKWLEVPAVIELESMGTGPANFLTLLLCSLIRETLKAHPKYDGDIRHIIFIEEAHNLIGPESEEQSGADADPKQAATAFVVKMLAEVRALKEGIVIADQLPTVMAQEVLKNTGLKIGLRITSADDRALLGSTMAASGLQLEEMSTFMIGQALIFYEKLKRPFTMRIKQWWGELGNDSEIEKMTSPKNDSELRTALKGAKTYTEENYKSISIICKKYTQLLAKLKQDNCMYWLETLEKEGKSINSLYNQLLSIEKGEKTASDYERKSLYDKYEQLCRLRDTEIHNVKKQQDVIDNIMKLYTWASTIERIKNGRWTRFGISDADYAAISLLQYEMCDHGIQLYKLLITVVGNTAAVKKKEKEIKLLAELYTDLIKDIDNFINAFGKDALFAKVRELDYSNV